MTERRAFDLAAALLVACVLLGGASAAGAAANALLQLFGLGLILWLLWRWSGPLPAEARAPLAVGALLLVVGLVSLVPLPAALWSSLPFRDFVLSGYRLMGMAAPALPMSLTPLRSVASLLSLIVPLAMFLLVLRLSADGRRKLATVLLVLACASIVLGAFQLMGGPRSNLRFYAITNPQAAVGWFANPNHLATLLLCAFPFTGVLAARAARGRRAKRSAGLIVSAAIALFLTVGIALSGSAAGYGLYLPVVLATVLIYRRAVVGRIDWPWAAGLGLLLAGFLILGLTGPLSNQSLTAEASDDPASRRVLALNTLEALADSFPVGTGLGTFQSVYRLYENPNRVSTTYANHAHNDYLELVLELGLPALLLIVGFLLWWARRSWQVWRNEFAGAAAARAGSVALGVVVLHSIVDYPLRTAAIAAVFAFACATLVPSAAPRARKETDDSAPAETLRHVQVS